MCIRDSDQAANENETASRFLDTLLSCSDTRAVKSKQQIQTLFADVSQRRNDYIEKVSLSRGVPQPTSWGEYTQEQWRLWQQKNSFDEKDMDSIVLIWKHEFELNDFREIAKVEQWREEGTRESKPKKSS